MFRGSISLLVTMMIAVSGTSAAEKSDGMTALENGNISFVLTEPGHFRLTNKLT